MASELTNAQFAVQCASISSKATHWAVDVLTLPDQINERASLASVIRFTDGIREQLELIDSWAGRVRAEEPKP